MNRTAPCVWCGHHHKWTDDNCHSNPGHARFVDKQRKIQQKIQQLASMAYQPAHFYWALVELLRRTTLMGYVLLVPTGEEFFRLLVGSMVQGAAF